MKVSILIRNFNYGRFLRRSVQSALQQDHPKDALEVIVVDDGSTDESPQILQEFADRIRVLHGPRRGAIAALNAGLSACSGEAFTLVDADDWAEPDLVSGLAAPLMQDAGIGFSYCDYFEEDTEGLNRRRISLAGDPFQGTAAGFLYRKADVEALGRYDESMMFAEYDLLAKTLQKRGGRHVAKPLYHYIRHGDNMTADPERVSREIDKLKARHGPGLKIREYRPDFLLPMMLRPAQPVEADARKLLAWREDPTARKASFRVQPLTWEEHWDWYRTRFDAQSARLYFAQEGGEDVGMIRLDRMQPDVWEVSIYLAPDHRYGRRGTRLLEMAAKILWNLHPKTRIQARIREDNLPSQTAFRKSGYLEREPIVVEGIPGHRWEKLPPR